MSVPPRPVLVLPGYGASGPGHWQSRWQAADPTHRRVVQRDWLNPTLDEWRETLEHAVAGCDRPPVLVAHSLACALVAHSARGTRRRVAGALLVAPADADMVALALDAVARFTPGPLERLPPPRIVLPSRDDPYGTLDRAQPIARGWRR